LYLIKPRYSFVSCMPSAISPTSYWKEFVRSRQSMQLIRSTPFWKVITYYFFLLLYCRENSPVFITV
jgi:hypothetical protein